MVRRPSRKKAKPTRVKNPLRSEDTTRRKKGLPPGRTLESVENQLVGLATDLAREQMKSGTASSQVITHFLKLGSSIAKLEAQKLAGENELLIAKTEALRSQKRVEDLYANALEAMRDYSGSTIRPRDSEEDEQDD